jgi:3' terminal RNA ribose 2'-O-methyltransferase Hen1
MRAKAYSIGIRIFWHPRAQLLSSAPGTLIVNAVSACAADDHAHPAARNRPRLPAPQEPWAYSHAVAVVRPGPRLYPEASDERCTTALLLDIDPVGLVRGRRPGPSLEPYVNDRPYVASSFLSSAIAEHFGTAMGDRSKERQALADRALPLEAGIAVLPARGGEAVVRRLFEPLGYVVKSSGQPLHSSFPAWGEAPYESVRLSATIRLRDLLGHLYVLMPVLDDQKHYWATQGANRAAQERSGSSEVTRY